MKHLTFSLVVMVLIGPMAISTTATTPIDNRAIFACAKTGENKSLSPIERVSVKSKTGDFYLLSVGKKSEPGWEMIVKINPCDVVFANPMGDPYSKYGVQGLPKSVVDTFEADRVKSAIKTQGRDSFFNAILSEASNGVLSLTPETEKALIGQGFKLPSGVRIVHPTIPRGGE
jgi:hypothetical protein